MAARNLVFTILGIDKGSKAFDQVGKAADRASERLDGFGKVGAKVLTAMPLAAAGAGLATVGALGAVGAGVIGLSAVILRNNEQVAGAASSLWADMRAEAQQAAAPLAGPMTQALETIHGTVLDLGPQLRELFSGAAPAVGHLSDGVSALARNAMPGLVTAVQSSGPVFRGMESAMADVGTGVTRFFTNLSRGAESSGQIMASTGRIVSDFAGFSGSLFAQLSNTGAPAVAALEGFLRKLEDTVLSLGSGAFPVLAASASGFLAVGSGLLSILNALSPVLGPLIGHLGAFAVALKLVNTVSFGQVGAAFTALKTQIGDAQGAAGKFKAGATGLASGGLLPLGIAAAGLGLILTGLGSAQQRAAQDAAAHQSRIANLTSALRESNGAIDANVKALAAKSLSEAKVGETGKKALEVARESGVSLGLLTDAYLGNVDAQKAVNEQLTEFIKSRAVEGTAMDEAADRANQLRNDVLPGLNSEYATSAQRAKDLAAATGEATAANKEAANAIKEVGDALLALVNKDIGYRNAVDATAKAQKAAADALKEHGVKSAEFADASKGVESALASQVQAAYDLAFANSVATTSLGREQDAALAMNREIIGLATATGGTLPRALGLAVSKLSETNLTALGATRTVNELGNEVIRLPDGKTVTVLAEDRATAKIQAIAGRRYSALIEVDTVFRRTPSGSVLNSRSAFGNAEGGRIRGPGTDTSDSIPRWLSNNEFVTRAREAKKPHNAMLLEAMNAGKDWRTMAAMGGGMGGGMAAGGPRGVAPSGGHGTHGTLSVAHGGDQAVASLIHYLIRTGKLQIKIT